MTESERCGSRLGPYRVEDRLGVGGAGEVFRAVDTRLDRLVALKRLRLDRKLGPSERRRFRGEAKALAALHHPGIVQVHDIVESDGDDWLVMELVPGPTLREVAHDRPVALASALDWGRQIAEALAAAHRKGIVHRDLKGENVRLDADGQVKLLDFGLAKSFGPKPAAAHSDQRKPQVAALTEDGTLLGTYRSMSPEQSRGQPVGPSSDLFSLGVLLYELLTGESPFVGDDPLETMERVRTHRQVPVKELRPEVPPEVVRLVDRLLEKAPSRRPRSAIDVAEVLTAARGRLQTDRSPDPRVAAAETTFVAPSPFDPPQVSNGSSAEAVTVTRSSTAARSRIPSSTRLLLLALTMLALAALAWALLEHGEEVGSRQRPQTSRAHDPMYVAVAEPELLLSDFEETVADAAQEKEPQAEDREDWPLLAAAIRAAILDTLLALEGIVPVDDSELRETPSSNLGLARALAAQEIVTSRLVCAERACQVTLHRHAARDGQILWLTSFEVPVEEPYLLATAVATRLRTGYPDHEDPPGRPRFLVDEETYTELLRLRQAHVRRTLEPHQILAQLEVLRQQAPAFPEIHLLEADVAHAKHFHSGDPSDLERAFLRLREASALDPTAIAPRYRLVSLAVESGRPADATTALHELERLAAGDARVEVLHALLLEQYGDTAQALELMRASARRHPSSPVLFNLASLEYRLGQSREARATLELLLERAPESGDARSFLAQLELLQGDLTVAETLYERLAVTAPRVSALSNLGLARMLLGRYEAARESFERALELEPVNPFSMLNLADAESLLGNHERARELYLEVLARTDDRVAEGDAPADWQTLTVRAQALVHLGRDRQAVAALQAALGRAPQNPQAAFEAALVYALLGENTSAVVNAERALTGFDIRWFELPWFDGLRDDEAFRQLLE